MTQSPGAIPKGLFRIISEADGVSKLDQQSPPQGPFPRDIFLNGNAAVVDDEEGDEPMADVNLSVEGTGNVPRRLGQASQESVSSGSTLSDESAGLLPFLPPKASAAVAAASSNQMVLAPTGSNMVELATASRSPQLVMNTTLLHARNSETHPPSFHRMDSGSSGSLRARSENSSNDWGYGWYEDVHASEQLPGSSNRPIEKHSDNKKAGLVPQVSSGGEVSDDILRVVSKDSPDAAAMAVTAPTYVLEESLSSQKLWKYTAGQRPPQPADERAFYEKMWAQNFERSQVKYSMPVEVLTATSPICLSAFAEGIFDSPNPRSDYVSAANARSANDQGAVTEAALVHLMNDPSQLREEDMDLLPRTVKGQGSDGDLTILVRGVNAFGTTVSKSFARPSEKGGGVDTVNISIASYRVVESTKRGKYAQFLVIYREGSIRDTFGVWKRYRDFERLAQKVTHSHEGCAAVIANVSPLAVTEEPDTEVLPNAITSWRLLQKRKRWYRCLDAGYLSLKVFLLERFLHDILFESSSPKLLRDFVGAGTALC